MSSGGSTTRQSQSGTTNSTQTQSGSTDVSGMSTNEIPAWMSRAGRNEYGILSDLVHGYQAPGIDPTLDLARQTQTAAQPNINPALNGAFNTLMGDRGGGYAEEAIKRLLAFNGDGVNNANLYGGGVAGGNVAPQPEVHIRDTAWKNFTDYDINKYMNPFTDTVVNNSVADIERQAAIEGLKRGTMFQKAGAFGGSRHGVLDALAAGEEARAVGDVSGKLRSDAFNVASGLIRGDQAGDFGSQAANQGADIQKAKIASDEAVANAAGARSAMASARAAYGQADALKLQALQSVLSGGINLGNLDVTRGQAQQGYGTSLMDRLTQLGQGMQERSDTQALVPYNMQQGLLQGLAGIPHNTMTTNQQSVDQSGTSTSHGTSTGTGTVREPGQDNTAQWLGLALSVIGMM